jgi:hypothetical protein
MGSSGNRRSQFTAPIVTARSTSAGTTRASGHLIPPVTPIYVPEPLDGPYSGGKPLWGHMARMLRDGGPKNPAAPPESVWECSVDETGHIRSRLRHLKLREPDPHRASKQKTGVLVNAAIARRWDIEQIRCALLDERNVGGEYYRYRVWEDPETYMLESFYEGSTALNAGVGRDRPSSRPASSTPASTDSPMYCGEGRGTERKRTTKQTKKPIEFIYHAEVVKAVKGLLAEGPVTWRDLYDSGLLRKQGYYRKYIKYLIEREQVVESIELLDRNGVRQTKVFRLAEGSDVDYNSEELDELLGQKPEQHLDDRSPAPDTGNPADRLREVRNASVGEVLTIPTPIGDREMVRRSKAKWDDRAACAFPMTAIRSTSSWRAGNRSDQ